MGPLDQRHRQIVMRTIRNLGNATWAHPKIFPSSFSREPARFTLKLRDPRTPEISSENTIVVTSSSID